MHGRMGTWAHGRMECFNRGMSADAEEQNERPQGFSSTTFPSRQRAIGVPCMRAVFRATFAARFSARPTAATNSSCSFPAVALAM